MPAFNSFSGSSRNPPSSTKQPESSSSHDAPPPPSRTPSRTSSRTSNAVTTCRSCSQPVYASNSLPATIGQNRDVYHNVCFRCSECDVLLDISTYFMKESDVVCKQHFQASSLSVAQLRNQNIGIGTKGVINPLPTVVLDLLSSVQRELTESRKCRADLERKFNQQNAIIQKQTEKIARLEEKYEALLQDFAKAERRTCNYHVRTLTGSSSIVSDAPSDIPDLEADLAAAGNLKRPPLTQTSLFLSALDLKMDGDSCHNTPFSTQEGPTTAGTPSNTRIPTAVTESTLAGSSAATESTTSCVLPTEDGSIDSNAVVSRMGRRTALLSPLELKVDLEVPLAVPMAVPLAVPMAKKERRISRLTQRRGGMDTEAIMQLQSLASSNTNTNTNNPKLESPQSQPLTTQALAVHNALKSTESSSTNFRKQKRVSTSDRTTSMKVRKHRQDDATLLQRHPSEGDSEKRDEDDSGQYGDDEGDSDTDSYGNGACHISATELDFELAFLHANDSDVEYFAARSKQEGQQEEGDAVSQDSMSEDGYYYNDKPVPPEFPPPESGYCFPTHASSSSHDSDSSDVMADDSASDSCE